LGTSGYVNGTFVYQATCELGDIILSVNSYGSGALPADGRLLPINGNTPLFSVLGTRFGGDGVTNFGLPNLTAFAPQGLQYSVCALGIFPSQN
jgi:microcystin-dependent protein